LHTLSSSQAGSLFAHLVSSIERHNNLGRERGGLDIRAGLARSQKWDGLALFYDFRHPAIPSGPNRLLFFVISILKLDRKKKKKPPRGEKSVTDDCKD